MEYSIYGLFDFDIMTTPTEADGNLPAGERNLLLFLLSMLTCSLINMQRKKGNLFTGKYYLETMSETHRFTPKCR